MASRLSERGKDKTELDSRMQGYVGARKFLRTASVHNHIPEYDRRLRKMVTIGNRTITINMKYKGVC